MSTQQTYLGYVYKQIAHYQKDGPVDSSLVHDRQQAPCAAVQAQQCVSRMQEGQHVPCLQQQLLVVIPDI